MSDYRDLVIQDLAADVLRLETLHTETSRDLDTFRELLSEALTRLAAANETLQKTSALLREFMGEARIHPPRFDPWYPSVDDQTDVSRMVKASEIRWK